jgi:hypothetical protein
MFNLELYGYAAIIKPINILSQILTYFIYSNYSNGTSGMLMAGLEESGVNNVYNENSGINEDHKVSK